MHYQSRSGGEFIGSDTRNIVPPPSETVLQHRHAALRSGFHQDDPEKENQFSVLD